MRDLDRLLVKALSLSHEPAELDELALELVRAGERKRLGLAEERLDEPPTVPDWVNRPRGEG